MWWLIGRDHPFLFSLCFWIFSSCVSGHQRGGLSVWDLFWVLVGCSSFHVSSGDLASSVFFRLLCVDFLFFPPGSTQVFDIKLLQNVFLGNSFVSLTFLVTSLVVLSVFGYWGFFSPFFWLLGYPVAVLLKFCSWKISFFSLVCLRLYYDLLSAGWKFLKF